MPLPKLLRLPVSTNRIFGLDLLRAFAIIIVMLGHGTTYVSHKFAFYYTYILRFDGVNLFFVLSGFLIGGILIRTLETKTASVATLWSFWVKRWIRTVPPYLLALVLVIVLQRIVWSPPPLRDYAAHFFFLQNLNWPGPKLYQEAWSLAVEEWFYLLSAPCVFVLAALRLKPQAAIVVTALTIIVLTVAHRYYYFLHTPPHTLLEWAENFRGIVLMRLDSLMYGMLAAYFAYYHKQGWLKYKGVKFAVGLALSLNSPVA
jgi:peptidoglycan/LPS O-acetylase OafA/YrhL